MRHLFVSTLIAGLLVSAGAAAEIRLREQARPANDTLTLGDLFSGLDQQADVVVGPAPAPGSRATYKIKHVVALARQHGLAWQPRGNEAPIVVARLGQQFGQRDVIDRILVQLRNSGLNGRHEIDLSGRLIDATFQRSAADLLLRGFEIDGGSGRFSGELVVLSENGQREFLPLSGHVTSVRQVPMVQRLIRRGQTVEADDVTIAEVRLAPGVRDVVDLADDVIGKAARRTLRPGQPLQMSDLTEPIIVKKGSLVTVTLKAPGLTLSTMARALEDASIGEAVKVMNSQSKRTIETTVVGPGQVRVQLRRQLAVAANQ